MFEICDWIIAVNVGAFWVIHVLVQMYKAREQIWIRQKLAEQCGKAEVIGNIILTLKQEIIYLN